MTEISPPGAHRTADGRFRNPWPDSEPRSLRDVLRWTRERRKQGRAPTPARGSFPTATPKVAYPRAGMDAHRATWIGHSTVLLQTGGLNVITDPVFCERAFPVQFIGPRRVMPPAMALGALPPLDLVLLSHSHYDHLDKAAVRHIAREHPDATWVTPLGLGRYIEGWGVQRVVELDWWGEAEVAGAHVMATPARHFSARRMGDRNATLWCGFTIEHRGKRAYFVGDTAYHPEFAEVGERAGPFDLVMMPIGAYDPRWFMHVVHVDPEEAIRAYMDLGTTSSPNLAIMLALHWGTFRLTDEPMGEPPRRATAAWLSSGLDPDGLWIAKFGETRQW